MSRGFVYFTLYYPEVAIKLNTKTQRHGLKIHMVEVKLRGQI